MQHFVYDRPLKPHDRGFHSPAQAIRSTCIADVRSAPYSRYCPQFNKGALSASLQAAGITYMFLGKELGARPDAPCCYEGGFVNFQEIAKREEFKRGIERLLADISKHRVALMCAEKDPLQCHRTIFIARGIKRPNLHIKHILANGSVEEHADAERRLVKMLKAEPTLFEPKKKETETIEQAYDQQTERIFCRPEEQRKPSGIKSDRPCHSGKTKLG